MMRNSDWRKGWGPAGAQISVVATVVDETLLVSIRDTGIGIPATLLPRVFDLFVQGARGLDRAQGGLGLGLTLVRHLTERHGGTVSAHSDGPGSGSEFVVRLPAGAEPALPPSTIAPIAAAPPAARVLVVDDNVDATEMLAEMLRAMGHSVAIAHDGAQALVLAAQLQPSTALLDIGLPTMNGHELAQRLRRLPGLERIRLVALSGYGQAEDQRRSLEAGFDVHLVKPATLSSILAAIAIPS